MKTRLKAEEQQKEGKISLRMDLLDVYSACLKNAGNLIEEANLLLNNKFYTRAFFLGFTAFEELGKSQLVADFFNSLISEKEFNSAFKDHKIKLAYIQRYVAIPQDQEKSWWIKYDKAKASNDLLYRVSSLYIEFQNGKLRRPEDSINSKMAISMVNGVEKYLTKIIEMEYLTERIGTKAFTK